MKLLLDTCAYLVASHDSAHLPRKARQTMASAETRLWSTASSWEVALKAGLGRMSLSTDALSPPDAGLTALRVTLLPVGHLHAKHVGQLPWIHKDPFDRLLIAQAILEGATIVTSDRDIPRYPGVTVVWE